uniref:BTB domain-containing protein n=1 Tax=Parastrongyloides trichosuri TaxID=131310 RepID=A0A0N4ZH94_PARTI
MDRSIKIHNSNEGNIVIDGQPKHNNDFAKFVKNNKKLSAPSNYKIVIFHNGVQHNVNANALASKSDFVSNLIQLFPSPLQLDFSDCSKPAIERVLKYLNTGDANFDPTEISSIYDIVVKLDIKPLRVTLKNRIDRAIYGANVERQLSKSQSRGRSIPRSNVNKIKDYTKCLHEITDLLKAIDKFSGSSERELSRRSRSVTRGSVKRRPDVVRSSGREGSKEKRLSQEKAMSKIRKFVKDRGVSKGRDSSKIGKSLKRGEDIQDRRPSRGRSGSRIRNSLKGKGKTGARSPSVKSRASRSDRSIPRNAYSNQRINVSGSNKINESNSKRSVSKDNGIFSRERSMSKPVTIDRYSRSKSDRNLSQGSEKSIKKTNYDNMIRDLSQISRRNAKAAANKKSVPVDFTKNKRRSNKGKNEKPEPKIRKGLSPYVKENIDHVINIDPYFHSHKLNQDQNSSKEYSGFEGSECSQSSSRRSSSLSNSEQPQYKENTNIGFQKKPRSEGFHTWLKRTQYKK